MNIYNAVKSDRYKNDRAILHSDCNCFYASVECLLNPNIRNLPVAVSGDAENRHGIILAKNEEAKKYNVKTGEAIWQAKKKCPQLLTVPARLDVYKKFSEQVRRIYANYTDQIEPFGLDEAWLDISQNYKSNALTIASEISERIKREIGITVSIGISFNKIFAKFGSDYKKPDAITNISRDNYKTIVWNSPARDLLYVGGATQKKLEQIGIYTIGDIAKAPISLLRKHLGKWGDLIYGFANGYDSSPVAKIGEYSEVKSIGNSTTAIRDLKTLDDIKVIAYVLCDSVCRRMREQGFVGKTVCISMRDTGLSTITRQHTLSTYTALTSSITKAAMALFKENFDSKSPLRSIGVSVTDFAHNTIPRQMDIFTDENKIIAEESLDLTLDKLKKRFGNYIIRPASLLTDRGLSAFNPKDEHTIHPVGYL